MRIRWIIGDNHCTTPFSDVGMAGSNRGPATAPAPGPLSGRRNFPCFAGAPTERFHIPLVPDRFPPSHDTQKAMIIATMASVREMPSTQRTTPVRPCRASVAVLTGGERSDIAATPPPRSRPARSLHPCACAGAEATRSTPPRVLAGHALREGAHPWRCRRRG
jgi:hypothetical protein